MDLRGLNGVYSVEEHLIENEIIDNAWKMYYRICKKKQGYKQWLHYHQIMKKLFPFHIYYATFTFNNEKVVDLKMNSFLRYLKRHGVVAYRLNYDKGDLNERLHLHGFICTKDSINNSTLSLYGWTKMYEMKEKTEEEEERIINYITNYIIKNNFFSEKVFTKWIKGIYNVSGSTSYNIY